MSDWDFLWEAIAQCRKAAEKLGMQFKLMINEQQLM